MTSYLVKEVDKERLYRHILEMEGPNHPIYSPDKLESAADYICSELDGFGLDVEEQRFKVEDGYYRNIEGIINTGENAELLLTAHYDTIPQSPGAEDNLSGVSVMLEAARILSLMDEPLNVRVIGFTLEEPHPSLIRVSTVAAQELDLMDDNFNFTKLHTQKLSSEMRNFILQNRRKGEEYSNSAKTFMDEHKEQMNEIELLYFKGIAEYYYGISLASWLGNIGLAGSTYWVEKKSREVNIGGVINFEMVGYVSRKPNSQSWPAGINPDELRKHLVENPYVGDFILGFGDINSGKVLNLFTDSCEMEGIDLPIVSMHVPMSYEVINEKLYDLLRCDQAPFWKEGIPAITLTTTADFRSPYYHTSADTIDKLDFEFMSKVCKSTIATAIKSSSLN